MKLFLNSSTITPNLVPSFEKLIGKPSVGLHAAFIPDAGYKHETNSHPDEEMSKDLIEGLQWDTDKISLVNENYESLQKLFQYDVIYVNGGYSGYLAQVMRESGFDKRLPELFAKNIVYVGSSAGSMVVSKAQDAASFYFGEPEPNALEIGGLGLVDFEFYPMHDHRWTEDLVEKIKAKRDTSLKYYLLRDRQALIVENEKVTTLGDIIILEKSL